MAALAPVLILAKGGFCVLRSAGLVQGKAFFDLYAALSRSYV